MFADYPSMQQWYEKIVLELPLDKKTQNKDFSWLYGKWMNNTPETTAENTLQHFDDSVKKTENKMDVKTTLNARAVEEITSLTIDKKQQEDYVLLHNFEKN